MRTELKRRTTGLSVRTDPAQKGQTTGIRGKTRNSQEQSAGRTQTQHQCTAKGVSRHLREVQTRQRSRVRKLHLGSRKKIQRGVPTLAQNTRTKVPNRRRNCINPKHNRHRQFHRTRSRQQSQRHDRANQLAGKASPTIARTPASVDLKPAQSKQLSQFTS